MKRPSAARRVKGMKEHRAKSNPFAPIDLMGEKKTGMRTQFAALCFRMRKGKPEILLITSRRTRRWIIPKGWPIDKMRPAESAAQEALEEAGVEGKSYDLSLGVFTYAKSHASGKAIPCVAVIYPLKVKTQHKTFLEAKQRKRRWFSQAEAARKVDEPELAWLISQFDPAKLKRHYVTAK